MVIGRVKRSGVEECFGWGKTDFKEFVQQSTRPLKVSFKIAMKVLVIMVYC
jgi:hypothetical protein